MDSCVMPAFNKFQWNKFTQITLDSKKQICISQVNSNEVCEVNTLLYVEPLDFAKRPHD